MATTDEIFDYVMNNPYNTNPNQLRTMLDSVSGGGNNVVVVTALSSTEGITDVSMTFDEIAEAYQNNAMIFLKLYGMPPEYGTMANFLSLEYFTTSYGNMLRFTGIHDDGNAATLTEVKYENNTWTESSARLAHYVLN